jgi:hypothetical protein
MQYTTLVNIDQFLSAARTIPATTATTEAVKTAGTLSHRPSKTPVPPAMMTAQIITNVSFQIA